MTVTSLHHVVQELVHWTRRNVTDPQDRGTYASKVHIGDGAENAYLPSTTHAVKFISGIDIDGTDQDYGTDYSLKLRTTGSPARVQFITTPTSGGSITINYNHGDTWVYPDYPRKDLSQTNYPRVAVDVIASTETPAGLGTTATMTDYMVTWTVYASGAHQVNDILDQIRSGLIAGGDDFAYVNYIHPAGFGPMGTEPGRHESVHVRNLDAIAKFNLNK